jgi:hypothetical protein
LTAEKLAANKALLHDLGIYVDEIETFLADEPENS